MTVKRDQASAYLGQLLIETRHKDISLATSFIQHWQNVNQGYHSNAI